LDQGYILIQPEMGKSIYCDTIFPQTRNDWKKYPTRKWIKDHLIPNLQDYNILIPDHSNFVLGLSTGARGAALIAKDLPLIFSGCAALSGDYDQTKYITDNLYIGYYGSFKNHTAQWTVNDNLVTRIVDLKVPIYIGHGAKDNIVPLRHSILLKEALDSIGNRSYQFHVDSTATHNYSYWNSEVDNMLNFFSGLTSSSLTSN
jgi:S-formylglutathione hydrolase FrmB